MGFNLASQFINDAWHTLQARREWSWRRRNNTFAPSNIYSSGQATTNSLNGNPFLVTGVGTTWTPDMIGRQIRIGGLMYPYYTIAGYLSPTAILLDQPWAGVDVVGQTYQILTAYFSVQPDFGYLYAVISIKDSYRLYTEITQAELAILDPQRTNYGQTYCVSFRDYTSQYSGVVGPAIPVTNPVSPSPISTTSTGYTYPANSTFVVQVIVGGQSGVATYQWLRTGQTAFQPPVLTSDQAQDLSDGVQVYWPDDVTYISGDIFIINCVSLISQSVQRFELWPAPTNGTYLYPYIYIAKEYDLTKQQPQLPPTIANRGEVLLEMALEKCAEYPGADVDHPNIYHDLQQAKYHHLKYEDMLIELFNNDDNIGVSDLDYQIYPLYPAPWLTGQWQQSHAPFLNG